MQSLKHSQTKRAFIGVFACLCFVLQQLLIPVHLTIYEHCVGDCEPPHAHASEDVGPGRACEHGGEREDDHEHHPAEEHLLDALAGVLVPTLVQAPAAVKPTESTYVIDRSSPVGVVVDSLTCPRPPPPRSLAPPRAPPVV